MLDRALPVLAAYLLLQSFTFAQPPSEPALPGVSPVKIEVAPEGEEDLDVIDDGFEIASVTYRGVQQPILLSKRAVTQGLDAQQLRSYTFYVRPNLIVSRDEIEKAFEDKKHAGKLGAEDVWTMRFKVTFLDDELRAQAAEQINHVKAGAGVTAKNIAMVPYRYLEINALTDQGPIRLGSVPDLAPGTTVATLSGRPVDLTVQLSGPTDFLQRFTKEPRLEGRFRAKGFSVQQNITTFGLGQFVKLGYHQFLTGDAKWNDRTTYKAAAAGATASLFGLVNVGASGAAGAVTAEKTSFVSRDQVREITSQFLTDMQVVQWKEFQSEQPALIKEMVTQLLSSAKEFDAEIVKSGDKLVIDPAIEKDIAPDVYTSLNAKVNSLVKAPTGPTTEKAAPDTQGGEVSFTDAGNGVVVPKTIRLYQFNQASFARFASLSHIENKATEATGSYTIPSRVSRVVVREVPRPAKTKEAVLTVDVKLEGNMQVVRGTDHELGSGGSKVMVYWIWVVPELSPDKKSIILMGRYTVGEAQSRRHSTTLDSQGHGHSSENYDKDRPARRLGEWPIPEGLRAERLLNNRDSFRKFDIPGRVRVVTPAEEPGHMVAKLVFEGDKDGGDDRNIWFTAQCNVKYLAVTEEAQIQKTVTFEIE